MQAVRRCGRLVQGEGDLARSRGTAWLRCKLRESGRLRRGPVLCRITLVDYEFYRIFRLFLGELRRSMVKGSETENYIFLGSFHRCSKRFTSGCTENNPPADKC